MRPILRLLPLSLSIAIALPALADDKPLNWDLCPPEDVVPPFEDAPKPSRDVSPERTQQPTDIESDRLEGTGTVPEYHGNVALSRGDQFLGADSLTFDTDTSDYHAEGNVRYQDNGIRILAERADGNQESDTHAITGIQYQLTERRGNGGADSVDLKGPRGQLHRSTYSTCTTDQRAWELRAKQIDFDTDDGFAVARNATIRLGKFPVLYTPWFKFPIDDRRRTGLLYPALSSSGRNGLDYQQPIYLNLAPNYDATLYPRFMSKRGFMLDTEFRYLYERGRGTLKASYLPNDDLRDRDRGRIEFLGFHNINATWQARANIAWVSDSRYTEDFGSRLNGMAVTSLLSTAGVYGSGQYWHGGMMAEHWQLTDYTMEKESLPYARLPRLYANWERPVNRWLDAGLYAETVHFEHSEKPGGERLDLKPYVTMRLNGPSWYINPTLAWRYTAYQLDRKLVEDFNPGGDRSPARNMPIMSVDTGLFFDRETRWKGKGFLHTLEPRLFYLYVPHRNQDDLPLFDTRAFTFSWGQLFRDNRYSGADRQTDANQLTAALSTRFIRQEDGFEKLTASIGQIFYFDDSKVTLPCNNSPCETEVERGKSAWIADANYAINDRWHFGASYQWDPKYRRQDLGSARLRYLIPNDGIVNLSYRYRRELLEQADLSFLYPINPRWSIVGRYYYSIYDRKLLEAIGGVQWDSCCLAIRVVGRRYLRNREGELDNSIQVEFVFKGLGSAGQNTERTLRRAILGYNRDDLTLVPPSNIAPNPDDYDPNLIP